MQPKPIKNNQKPIWDIVIEEMQARKEFGLKNYGTHLQAFNGRDPLIDLKEELLDALAYVTQLIVERDSMVNQDDKKHPCPSCGYEMDLIYWPNKNVEEYTCLSCDRFR